jgi:hypothetical protein
MNAQLDDVALRRYVLGQSSADERDRIERGYFDDPDALDLVCAAEDDLIDEYLSNRLVGEEREHFEAYYLAAPQHRTRVAVARALKTATAPAPEQLAPALWPKWWAPLAAAAALVLIVSVVLLLRSASKPETAMVTTTATPPAVTSPSEPRANAPRGPEAPVADKEPAVPSGAASIVALSISPINVRGSGESAGISIPRGTSAVRLLLQGEPAEPALARGRVIIRTVPGREVWRGATASRSIPASALASVDVPAGQLPPDDYIVELLAPDANGRDVERYRYFFRVRRTQDVNKR